MCQQLYRSVSQADAQQIEVNKEAPGDELHGCNLPRGCESESGAESSSGREWLGAAPEASPLRAGDLDLLVSHLGTDAVGAGVSPDPE